MIKQPEDTIGNWYLDLAITGDSRVNSFILDYSHKDKEYLIVKVKRSSLYLEQWQIELRFLKDPIVAGADIEKLNRKLIKTLFNNKAKNEI